MSETDTHHDPDIGFYPQSRLATVECTSCGESVPAEDAIGYVTGTIIEQEVREYSGYVDLRLDAEGARVGQLCAYCAHEGPRGLPGQVVERAGSATLWGHVLPVALLIGMIGMVILALAEAGIL